MAQDCPIAGTAAGPLLHCPGMKNTGFDPLRLDVQRFATDRAALEGAWPQAELPRLTDARAVPPTNDDHVAWHAQGEPVAQRGGTAQIWLHLAAQADVMLQCQRCLEPVPCRIAVDRRLRFVDGEDEAARLDADSEDDVLALPRRLDLRELVEDELLMALPIIPRHEDCALPGSGIAAPDDPAEPAEHPFAALTGWKVPGPR